MVFNSFLGKKEIAEAMLGHTAAQYGLSSWLRALGRKYGFLYVKLFGYPFDPASRILARETLKLLERGEKGRLLDVGCSHGAFDFELAKRGFDVVGIDLNQESVEVGEKIKKALGVNNVTFRQMDISSNLFPGKCFDVVLVYETLEHIKNDSKALSEIYRILKEEGLLVISVPYAEEVQEYDEPLGACMTSQRSRICIGKGGGHYRNGYNLNTMRPLLEKNGFMLMHWNYICLSKWLESSVLTFPLKYPLSLLIVHFSKNRTKLKVVAKKV